MSEMSAGSMLLMMSSSTMSRDITSLSTSFTWNLHSKHLSVGTSTKHRRRSSSEPALALTAARGRLN